MSTGKIEYTRVINLDMGVVRGASGMPYVGFSLELAEKRDCPEGEAIARRAVEGEVHFGFDEDDEGIEVEFNYVWDITEAEDAVEVYNSLAPVKQQVPLTANELEAVYAVIESRIDDFIWDMQRAWDQLGDENRAADYDE